MTKTYQQWLKEQADIIIRAGLDVPDIDTALIDAEECNDQTGLAVLVVDEKGKGVCLITEEGYVEFVE